MISRSEIERSFTAVWGIFLGRPEAIRGLDTSNDGFWRSFQVILLVAPLYALASIADWQALTAPDRVAEGAIAGEAFIGAKIAMLALDWVTFPIVLAALAGFLGIKHQYATFIVARNWSVPVAIGPFAAIALLDIIGLLPAELVLIPSLLAFGFSLRLSFMVARIALGAATPVAVAYVALDFLISLALARVVSAVFGIALW